MDYSIWTLCLIGLSWLLGGIIGGITAMGTGIVALAIMLMFIPPLEAIPLCMLIGIFSMGHVYFAYRARGVWREIRFMLAGAVPGAISGFVFLYLSSDRTMRIFIALLISAFLVLHLVPGMRKLRIQGTWKSQLTAGYASGLVNASTGIGGVPIGIYAIWRGWAPDLARGNIAVFNFYNGLLTLAILSGAGFYDWGMALPVAIGATGSVLGQQTGIILGRGIKPHTFRLLVLAFLAIAAVTLFFRDGMFSEP